jgi:hypothetical protein
MINYAIFCILAIESLESSLNPSRRQHRISSSSWQTKTPVPSITNPAKHGSPKPVKPKPQKQKQLDVQSTTQRKHSPSHGLKHSPHISHGPQADLHRRLRKFLRTMV